MRIETTRDGRNFVRSQKTNQGYKLWFAVGMKVISFLLKVVFAMCVIVFIGECENPITFIVKSLIAAGLGYLCYKAVEKIDESF